MMVWGHPGKQEVPSLCSLKTVKVKDFAQRRQPQSAVFQSGDTGHRRFQNGGSHTGFQNGSSIELFLTIRFRELSNQGTQLLQPRERKAWLLLQLQQTQAAPTWCWFQVNGEYMSSEVKAASTPISEDLGGQAVCPRGQYVNVKAKVQWRPQKF